MKIVAELDVVEITVAKPYDGKAPEHKTELRFRNVKATKYGDEITYLKAKSMLEPEKFKVGKNFFEMDINPYRAEDSNVLELKIKNVKPVK